MRLPRLTPLLALALTVVYAGIWAGAHFLVSGEHLVDLTGWCILYLIGLAWAVYLVERYARSIDFGRCRDDGVSRPSIPIGGEVPIDRRGGWNPLDPAALYYGRHDQRLRQSFAVLAMFSLFFGLVYFIAHLRFGNENEDVFDLPAGGGSESIKASSVKVQKVIRKKYVINPYSSFAAPPTIDQVEVKLTEETAHRHQAGQGPGGLGKGPGQGGGFGRGKGNGKWRFIRVRHSDKYWDKNFGVAGDRNLLTELLASDPTLQGKVVEETEAWDIARLRSFPAKKSPPLIYVCGAQTFSPTPAEKRILERYLTEQHGMILGDNLGGAGFHNSFFAAMKEITNTDPVEIPRDDRIHSVPFSLPQVPIVVAHGGTVPRGWKIDGRWAVYYHPGALSDAWRDDHAGIKNKSIVNMCYQLGINILYYAYSEYDQWLESQSP